MEGISSQREKPFGWVAADDSLEGLTRAARRQWVANWLVALLGVDHSNVNLDSYAAVPIDPGRSWGLARGWVRAYAIEVTDAVQSLVLDESGKTGA